MKSRLRRLPDSEFAIMKAIWEGELPATTASVMAGLGEELDWKAPTVISFLLRLVDHGFLRTEKRGRERIYFPLISEEDYLQFETERFVQAYHKNSSAHLINALIGSETVSSDELDEMAKIIAEEKKRLEAMKTGGKS